MNPELTAAPAAGAGVGPSGGSGVGAGDGSWITHRVGATRGYAWLLLVAGALGLAAAITLTLEKIRLLENPHYTPSCNINPIISCGSVMRTAQASAFGFPNSLIGVGAFAVVVTIGVVALTGVRLPRWFWLGLQAGTLFGIGFVCWLIDQTLYSIGAVCPYCIVVWTATIPLFWFTTVHNLRTGTLPLPSGARAWVQRTGVRWAWVVPVAGYAVIVLLVLNRFWWYWSTHM
ncbi:vitamin K epoxide reductase family protein [Streptacidiphilus fuscans]|uniref:Vitamin K epoxide reductase family protein n=1 Tax=Streptacidiphilus fuscans TaxID=2789292 RepID=A0A931B6L1_9ACTN|nr:vitamin K epoxide reductase family protein [Streptacidiphilus fuscans]MBF9072059.1 vitamin K epoxide reductase family protein [Streptacidiphilus fuscans]